MRRISLIAGMVLVVTVGHYTMPTAHVALHDLMQRLYYLPIILAGFWFGRGGGLLTGSVVCAVYLPHIFMQWGGAHTGNVEKFLEMVVFLSVGTITGALADRLRGANSQLREAYDTLRQRSNQLLLAEEQLGRSGRLAALGELSAELAHEIRNPLGAIKGAAEIIRDKVASPDPLREFAVILSKETDRLNAVVEGTLAMARRRVTPEQPGNPGEAVRGAAELTHLEAKAAGVEVVLSIPADLPQVLASTASLQQVFLNLALNAVQAMPAGGRLTVSAVAQDEKVQVAFADTGAGIAPSDREQLFTPFFTRRERGTGLGLAISKRLVAGAGGHIQVQSEPGHGSVFTVMLPVAREA